MSICTIQLKASELMSFNADYDILWKFETYSFLISLGNLMPWYLQIMEVIKQQFVILLGI